MRKELAALTTYEFVHEGPSFDLPWPPARNLGTRVNLLAGPPAAPALLSPSCCVNEPEFLGPVLFLLPP